MQKQNGRSFVKLKNVFIETRIIILAILVFAIFGVSCEIIRNEDIRGGFVPASTIKAVPESTTEIITSVDVTTSTIANRTATPNMGIYDQKVPILVTQRPPIVFSTLAADSEEFIYNNLLVTFELGPDNNSMGFLNVDDVYNSTAVNSDIIVQVENGMKDTDYDLFITNYAWYYFTGKDNMDYSSCKEYFPLHGFTQAEYIIQAYEFVSGKSYCVLTNEGRIAIVDFVENSIQENTGGTINISLKVTTYKQQNIFLLTPIVEFTPTPTLTLNVTPTLCINKWQPKLEARYISTGMSACQALEVERTIQKFVTFVAEGDRESMAGLLDFPILMANNDINLYIADKEEFLLNYDKIFIPDIVRRISRAKLDDVMGGDSSIGVYWPINNGDDGIISFSVGGKIQSISFYGIK